MRYIPPHQPGFVVKWLSRLPVTEEIAGSNPVEPAKELFTNTTKCGIIFMFVVFVRKLAHSRQGSPVAVEQIEIFASCGCKSAHNAEASTLVVMSSVVTPNYARAKLDEALESYSRRRECPNPSGKVLSFEGDVLAQRQ
jgi:hypothetical protein